MKISDIFKVKTGRRIIEQDIYNHKGNFPCVTAQTNNNGIAWRADLKWLKEHYGEFIIYDNCITWSKDGVKAGTLFYRDYPFYPNDHCGVLIPKEEYKDKINLKWFVYTQQEYIKSCVTQQNSQGMLYNGEMAELEIEIPMNNDGEFDIDYQNKIVEQYEKLEILRQNIIVVEEKINNILNLYIKPENVYEISINEVFDIHSENHKFTEEYIYFNQGKFPIYSATLDKPYGYVSTPEYSNPVIIVVNYGDAGKVRYIEGEYNIGRNVCGLTVKDKYKEKINLKYFSYTLQNIFKLEMSKSNMGAMSQETIKNTIIQLPITCEEDIDIEFQNKVVEAYEKLEKIKVNIRKILNKIDSII